VLNPPPGAQRFASARAFADTHPVWSAVLLGLYFTILLGAFLLATTDDRLRGVVVGAAVGGMLYGGSMGAYMRRRRRR
jgi:membrane associated rhomboid family serine protease